ncbi:MAG: hypothetical protein HYT79_08645 [Elusimicrobia bacterium]|nr:hypothetical protein [Elusimicrobiota bacterium]
MKKLFWAFVVLISGLSWVQAKERAGAPALMGEFKPAVGTWGEYEYSVAKDGKKQEEKGRWRLAVVGKQGGDYWIENKFTAVSPKPKKGENMGIMKMLVGKNADQPKKVLMKSPDGRVMDMTAMMKMNKREAPQSAMKKAGKEKVSVPAGTFTADKYTYESEGSTGEVWVKAGIGPNGVIKQTSRSGKSETMSVLLAYGKDAKPEVMETEAANPMAGMPQMPEGMPDIGELMKKMGGKKSPDGE